MDTALAREVLAVADAQAAGTPRKGMRFAMETWGSFTSCGTVSCLGGTALLLRGWTLEKHSVFRSPGGEKVTGGKLADEARRLLGMTPEDEFHGLPDAGNSLPDEMDKLWFDTRGVKRFRSLTVQYEKRQAEGGGA